MNTTKNALITGTSKGIGRAIAKILHADGFHIFGVYKWSESYQDERELADSLGEELENYTPIPCDLRYRESYEQIASVVGNSSLQAIVHNAAEFFSNPWKNLSIDDWDRSISVNMEASLLLTKRLEKNLVNNAGIVAISSSDGFHPGFDDIGYAASKSGLNSIVRSLAAALAHKNIRVNAVVPGWVDTEMAAEHVVDLAHDKSLLGRNARPEEIAAVVLFLLSEKASFITGSLIPVDGGYDSVDSVVKKEFENR